MSNFRYKVRKITKKDIKNVEEMFVKYLNKWYEGDHTAHARRLIKANISWKSDDKLGNFTKKQIMFVVERDGEIVGVLNLVIKRHNSLKISPIIVKEKYRGQGIGKLLMDIALETAKREKCRFVYLTVTEGNPAANFFMKFGFIPTGNLKYQYSSKRNEIPMIYFLSSQDSLFYRNCKLRNLPMEASKIKIFKKILEQIVENFEALNKDEKKIWIDSILKGYERYLTYGTNPEIKPKICKILETEEDEIVGITVFTPKKGGSVKITALWWKEEEYFISLIKSVKSWLYSSNFRKIYWHYDNTSPFVVTSLMKEGWKMEAILPYTYGNKLYYHWSFLKGDKL